MSITEKFKSLSGNERFEVYELVYNCECEQSVIDILINKFDMKNEEPLVHDFAVNILENIVID